MRILIVDDMPDNIRVLNSMLAEEGLQISVATSGGQALKIARACPPDLVLLDIMMPGMDGYEVCRAMKADPRLQAIPIIFITAMSDEGHETLGLEAGAVDYITKPFKETIVKLRVKTHLELKWQRDLLDSLSHLDGLTGIANRRSFDERLDLEWRRAVRFCESLSLAIIDIDNFKIYNDTHGHLAGDECLRRVARALADTLNRAGDFVARYGGEEFVFLLPGIDADGLQAITEKLRANVEALHIPHGASDVSPWVTVSAGAARCYPSPGIPPTTIIDSADEQLYRAKKQGKNRICQV